MANENTNSLNTYLADLAVLNIKVHNLHWNVIGKEFKAVHKMTEKIYHELNEQFDTVAEAMKMHGELPLATMSDYMDYTTIEEIESRDYTVEEALEIMDDDCGKMINTALEIRAEADNNDDFMTANLMEEYLAKFYKYSWFIKSMLADDSNIELAEWEEIPEGDDDDEHDKPLPPHLKGKAPKGPKKPKEKKKK